jgi:hypothetical protein
MGFWMFPFYTLTFALCLSVADPNFITSDNMTQIPHETYSEMVTDIQTAMPTLIHQLFWKPHCTDFMEVNFLTEEFTGRTMTNLQLVCYFNSSQWR